MAQTKKPETEIIIARKIRFREYYDFLGKDINPTNASVIAEALLRRSGFGKKTLKGIRITDPALFEDKGLEATLKEVNIILEPTISSKKICYGRTIYHPNTELFDYSPAG